MSVNDNLLLHWGVKGMKWGVRKSKKDTGKRIKTTIGPSSKRPRKTILDKADGLIVPAPAALALYAMDGISNRNTKRRIAKSLNSKVKDLNKRDLELASAIVRRYYNVTVSSGDITSKVR